MSALLWVVLCLAVAGLACADAVWIAVRRRRHAKVRAQESWAKTLSRLAADYKK